MIESLNNKLKRIEKRKSNQKIVSFDSQSPIIKKSKLHIIESSNTPAAGGRNSSLEIDADFNQFSIPQSHESDPIRTNLISDEKR